MIDFPLIEKVLRLDERHKVFVDRVRGIEDIPSDHDFSFHFSAKDNLCTSEFQATAGSKILQGYHPPFDATAVRRLREAGGFLLGKTNMDEFGFGTFSTNSAFGVPKNPFDLERSCGGSSGGAAAAACLLEDHLALGVSTGGSISCPASFCGVVGFTPTYGRVSRWGLIDYANSLDKIGLLSRSAKDVRKYLPFISGPDARDPTSLAQPSMDLDEEVRSIAIPEEAMPSSESEMGKAFLSAMEKLESDLDLRVEKVSLKALKYALPAYYILATSEASTNLARYCGMRFGVLNEETDEHFNEFFSKTRSACFGKEAKRRILLGTFSRMVGFRDRYYMKALAVRELINHEYGRVFKDHDLILTPTMPFISPRFDEIARMRPVEMYEADYLTVPANLGGLPHVSVPCGYASGMPIGMQFVAPHWREGRLLTISQEWEEVFQYRFPEVG